MAAPSLLSRWRRSEKTAGAPSPYFRRRLLSLLHTTSTDLICNSVQGPKSRILVFSRIRRLGGIKDGKLGLLKFLAFYGGARKGARMAGCLILN